MIPRHSINSKADLWWVVVTSFLVGVIVGAFALTLFQAS